MTPPLELRDHGAVRVFTLNRPERLNALDLDLRQRLGAALAEAGETAGVRVVLITGAGARAFCAGQDVNESAALASADEGGWIDSWHNLFRAFFDFPKPLVAAVNGVAAGGGMEIAMFCDLRIAAESSRWLMAEVDVGLPAIMGSHWLSALVMDSRMTEIVLSGRQLPSAEVLAAGLVHEVAPDQRLAEVAMERALALAAKPPVAMQLDIRRFRDLMRASLQQHGGFDALLAYQREAMASGQPQEAMHGFLARRKHD